MDVRRPPMGGSDRRDLDMSDRPSDPQLHQPVALAPTMRTVHGPDGLLAGQGPSLPPPPGASHMASSIGQQSQQQQQQQPPPLQQQQQQQSQQQQPPPPGFAQLPPPQAAQLMPGQPPQPVLPPFGQQIQPLNATQQPILNDALSYLDQVKVQFQAHPDVYNKFLDIMKEFKSGAIDTPGVIERVSQLFAGHPNLIQGFNTFLPPGYKIECGMGDDPNSIRVTTPSGTTQSVLPARPVSTRPYGPSLQPPPLHFAEPNGPGWQQQQQQQQQQQRGGPEHGYQDGRMPPQMAFAHAGAAPPPGPGMVMSGDAPRDQPVNAGHPDQRTLPPPPHMPQAMNRGSQGPISAAESQILSMVPVSNGPAGALIAGAPGADKRAPVEFNHAINYVNKIKNRFASQPDIYKQFLEILQTYQRESKPIGDVYSQVTRLFDSAPDLLEDFKQFLPESAAHANAVARANEAFPISSTRTDPAYQALVQANLQHTPRANEASRLPPMGSFAPTPSSSRDKRKRADKAGPGAVEQIVLGGRPGIPAPGHVAKKQKTTGKAVAVTEIDPLSVTPSLVPAMPPPLQAPSTGASADDLQVFEKIRKEMGNKAQFTEFIKLVNLFNQDLITGSYCLYRAKAFLDPKGTSFEWLKGMLGNPSDEPPITNAPREVSSARVSLAKCRNMGPSYRLLPKLEHNQKCSGRDELCMSVLNDEWVSHPTWESEEAGFVAHKKTQWEEALHRIEEERHDYDTNIEAVSRTIQLLEPYVINIEAGREVQVDSKLGGSSEFIYKRAIYKVYGRESGAAVIERLFTNPTVVIPHLFLRLKDVREKWKAGQRQWNEIWRQQMQANYDKSLDPQGAAASRNTDRRQFQSRTLQNEARARKDGSSKGKASSSAAPTKEDYQFVYAFTNDEVLADTLQLILTQIDTKTDDANIFERTKEFFDLCLGKVTSSTTDTDVMEQDQPAQSIENPTRTKHRRKGRSRHLAESKPPGSGSASRGTSPQAESANEAETGEASSSVQQGAPTPRWFEPPNHPSINQPTDGVSRPASNVQTPREDVSMGESGDKDSATEDSPRSEYHMYCNANLYCFMRLFGSLYERLESLYNLEDQAKLAIESHGVDRPAVPLGMMQNKLAEQFERPSESNGNKTYYKQMVQKFHNSITQPTESSTMSNIEELLRTFWLYGGYKLYSLDRLLIQMERLAALMFSADKDRQTENLVTMFKKNAIKKPATPKDDASYRKAALKLLQQGGKDKNSEETTYRVTFIETPVKAMYIQLLDKDSPAMVVETDEDRWQFYVAAYAQDVPTEGVDMQEGLLARGRRWPFIRKQIRDSRDMDVCTAEKMAFQVHSVTYKLTFLRDFYDIIEAVEWNGRSKKEIGKLRKKRGKTFMKALKDEEKEEKMDDAENADDKGEQTVEDVKETETTNEKDVEMADITETEKPAAAEPLTVDEAEKPIETEAAVEQEPVVEENIEASEA